MLTYMKPWGSSAKVRWSDTSTERWTINKLLTNNCYNVVAIVYRENKVIENY